MKKLSLLILTIATVCSFKAIAQTGINTTSPTTTLEIDAKHATGNATDVDGILIPRVDRLRAQSMTGVPVSTMVYINSIATGTANGTTANVDAIGYYYFDGSVWAKFSFSANIYTTDGTLASNRTVTQGANRLAFTGSVVNAFSVNGTNFSVDAANSRVGIGTAAPTNKLTIVGPTTASIIAGTPNTSAQLRLDDGLNTALDFGIFANAPFGSYIYSYNKGASYSLPLSLNPVAGNVGIGTYKPQGIFNIVADNLGAGSGNDFNFDGYGTSVYPAVIIGSALGTEASPANLTAGTMIGSLNFKPRVNGGWLPESASIKSTYWGNGGNDLTDLSFATSGTTRMTIDQFGNIGIGTTTPHALLQLSNTVITNRKVVLYESANNNHQFYGFGMTDLNTLRYQVDGVGSDHVFYAATSGSFSNELVRIKGSGNVGIGTPNPSEKLHVLGNILASGTITPSDIRIKKDILDNTYGLREIMSLRTINYRYKDEHMGKDKKLGFIAQEVKAMMPELVSTANDEIKTLGVNYAEMTVVLTKAVQELQEIFKQQQAEIDALKKGLKTRK